MTIPTLDDIDLAGKRVLVRLDLNVPTLDGEVTDDTRIRAHVPTIREVLEKGGVPLLLSHFGRPKGEAMPALSLAQVRGAVEAAIAAPVAFVPDCTGAEVAAAVRARPAGGAILLENTRFHPGDEANDAGFAADLAANADVFVNDAFSASHRAHASTEGLARLLPSVAGRQMQAEIEALERVLGAPARPVIAVVGGAKVSTKLALLANLVERVDVLVIGGGMANTFLAAEGIDVGRSLAELDMAETAKDIRRRAERAGCEIVLPRDAVVAHELASGVATETVPATACPEDMMILDAGPETVEAITARLETARTLLWNGPLGAFETPPFDTATIAAARRAAELTEAGHLLSVAGGGDTVAALNLAGLAADFSYVSTAGGAFLEWLEGRSLPGVAALGGDG